MKLRCDVCEESDAAVFCSADEAALCSRCDGCVHRANKLASRHQRFSLVIPQAEDAPPCDACQERRAFMFCQQDRRILCGECDLMLHAANEQAKKHDRFVLTGLMLSKCLQTYKISADQSFSNEYNFDVVPDFNSKVVLEGTVLDQSKSNTTNSLSLSPMAVAAAAAAAESVDVSIVVGRASASEGDGLACSSSLSKYLMETLPGWQVDELLESCSASSGMLKNGDSSQGPLDTGISNLESSGVSAQSWGFWVPQAAPSSGRYPTKAVEEVEPNPSMDTNVVMGTRNFHKRWKDDGFTVPQIGPAATASCKRNRSTREREWEWE